MDEQKPEVLPEDEKLTPRQERFCQEYFLHLNGTLAAMDAGYSPDSARAIASQHLTKLNIQKRLEGLAAERATRTAISQDYVIYNLREILERCMEARPVRNRQGKQVYVSVPSPDPEPRPEEVVIALDQVRLAAEGEDSVSLGDLAVVTDYIRQLEDPSETQLAAVYGFDAMNANKSLELLGRHMKMFTDNVNLTMAPVQIVDDVDNHDDDMSNDPTLADTPTSPVTLH